jgi:hypothetical protein
MAPFSLLLGTLLAGMILFAGPLLVALVLLERRTRRTGERAQVRRGEGAEPARWSAKGFGRACDAICRRDGGSPALQSDRAPAGAAPSRTRRARAAAPRATPTPKVPPNPCRGFPSFHAQALAVNARSGGSDGDDGGTAGWVLYSCRGR